MKKVRTILDQALDRFEEAAGVKIARAEGEGNTEVDAVVTLKKNEHTARYGVEVRKDVTRTTIGGIARMLRTHEGDLPMLLVAEYFTPEQMATLRELGIPCIDAQGNAFVDTGWLYVYIQGIRRQRTKREHATGADLFGWAGTKVIFALLCVEGMRTAPYREIADVTGVALGTVARVMQEMLRTGYLRRGSDGGARLANARHLADRWVTAYAEKLRARQWIGRYEAGERMNAEVIRACHALLGGETAAQHLHRTLKPGIETVYLDGEPNELILRLRLKMNPKGNVELRRKFWNFDCPEHAQGVTPHLLTYADLLAVADPRTMEAAGKIYEEFLDRHFREA